MTSILKILNKQTETNADKLLYAYLNIKGAITQSYTYAEFLRRVNDIASYIQRTHRLRPGERILLAYPPGLELICALFACVQLGLIPVPVYPPSSKGFRSALYKMTFIAQDSGATAVLTDRFFYWSMRLNLKKTQLSTLSFKTDYISGLKWIVSDDAPATSSEDFPSAYSDVAFLQYTSGSTNNPKGVMVTHDNIIHNCNIVVDHLPVGVSWLPQYHDMGLIGYYLFFALKGGTTYGFSPVDFIERPALWFETITKYKGTASSAPNFAYEYCLRPDKIPPEQYKNFDLSSLRFLMTAAEPVRSRTYQEFKTKFEPYGLNPKSFFSAYGLAEFTLAVSNYGRSVRTFYLDSLSVNKVRGVNGDHTLAGTQSFVSCGKPLGDTKIKIVDTSNGAKEVADGSVGEIWLDGRSKCKGYWNRPELSKEVFNASVTDALPGGSWLRTGDLGFIYDGELFVCGRNKDLIIIRGQNYYPQEIECIAEGEAGVRKGCVAAFTIEHDDCERLIVVAEIKDPKRLPPVSTINRRMHQTIGVGIDEIVYTHPRTIPKTSSGKIARHQVKALYIDGKLKAIKHALVESKEVNGNEGHPELLTLFRKYGLNGTENETLTDSGLDSVKITGFVYDLKLHLQHNGYKDLLDIVETRLVMKISVAELFSTLQGINDVSLPFRFHFKQAFAGLRAEHQMAEKQMMSADAKPVVRKRHAKQTFHDREEGHILLTGGTGFFGPFLLKSLLEQTTNDVYVIVRADEVSNGHKRLLNAFESSDPDNGLLHEFDRRVKVICGDLSRPRLGFDVNVWDFLALNIHTIYHNGAHVNYLFDYESMRYSNVGGTNEVVNLAWDRRQKILNHISTTFIFGWSVKETLFESDSNESMDLLDFGYSQSKWVADQIIRQEIQQGLRARIFRPALLSPSISGDGCNLDISIRLLAFMLKHGIGTSAKNQVSFTPADLAANNIIAISQIEESIGLTFHVTRDEYASMADITSILGGLTGNDFRVFRLKDFVPEVVSRCEKEDALFPLLDFLVRSADNISSMEFKRYDNSNYRRYRAMSPSGKSDPPLEAVVSGILRFMEKQGLATFNLKQVSNV